jgi:hypothetical protein
MNTTQHNSLEKKITKIQRSVFRSSTHLTTSPTARSRLCFFDASLDVSITAGPAIADPPPGSGMTLCRWLRINDQASPKPKVATLRQTRQQFETIRVILVARHRPPHLLVTALAVREGGIKSQVNSLVAQHIQLTIQQGEAGPRAPTLALCLAHQDSVLGITADTHIVLPGSIDRPHLASLPIDSNRLAAAGLHGHQASIMCAYAHRPRA